MGWSSHNEKALQEGYFINSEENYPEATPYLCCSLYLEKSLGNSCKYFDLLSNLQNIPKRTGFVDANIEYFRKLWNVCCEDIGAICFENFQKPYPWNLQMQKKREC